MLTATDARITNLTMRQMENRLTQLEQTVLHLTSLIPEASMPEACQKRTCSYFTHYLNYGGPDLSHAQFHDTEKAHLTHLAGCKWDWKEGPCPNCVYYEEGVRA